MDALTARFPGCRIAVVGTPGSEAAMATANVRPGDTFIHRAARMQPFAFLFSPTAVAVWRWRYDDVAILWNDPDGTGSGNVDRTACLMSRGGYLAITPDGTIVNRSLWPQLRREIVRVGASAAVGGALGLLLYFPAMVASAFRRVGVVGAAFRRPIGPAEAGPDGIR
jgi:hypothetical protein